MQITVGEVMSPRALTVLPHTTLAESIRLLLAHGHSELYVIDESADLLGVVPDYELLKAQMSCTADDTPIEQLMSRHMRTTAPECLVNELAPLFRESYCRNMAVVDGGKLVGVIDRCAVMQSVAANSAGADDALSGAAETRRDSETIRTPRFLATPMSLSETFRAR